MSFSKMSVFVPFQIRLTFAIYFYKLWNELKVMETDIPLNVREDITMRFTSIAVIEELVEYVSDIQKITVTWKDGVGYFEIDIQGNIHYYRDPENYCYFHATCAIEKREIMNDCRYIYYDTHSNKEIEYGFRLTDINVNKIQ